MIYIGIDPDVSKSGYAVVNNGELRGSGIHSFFPLIDLISDLGKCGAIIIIEAGWLNIKSNWHKAANERAAQRIAKNVGANHQIGKLIAEYCERNNFKYELVRPVTSKVPKKILEKELGIKIKNQDEADAIMLVHKYIRKPKGDQDAI